MPTLSGRIWATLPHSAWRPPPLLLCARASATSTSHHHTLWPSRPACCATRERGNVGYVSIRRVVPPPCAGSPPSSWLLIPLSRCSPSSRLSHCQCVLRTLPSSHLFLPIWFYHCHSHCSCFSLFLLHQRPSPNLQMTPSASHSSDSARLFIFHSFSHTVSLSFSMSVFLPDRSEGHKLLSSRPQESSKTSPAREQRSEPPTTHTHTHCKPVYRKVKNSNETENGNSIWN